MLFGQVAFQLFQHVVFALCIPFQIIPVLCQSVLGVGNAHKHTLPLIRKQRCTCQRIYFRTQPETADKLFLRGGNMLCPAVIGSKPYDPVAALCDACQKSAARFRFGGVPASCRIALIHGRCDAFLQHICFFRPCHELCVCSVLLVNNQFFSGFSFSLQSLLLLLRKPAYALKLLVCGFGFLCFAQLCIDFLYLSFRIRCLAHGIGIHQGKCFFGIGLCDKLHGFCRIPAPICRSVCFVRNKCIP